MRTRTLIAGLISLPINAVIFGTGAIAVLSIPGLAENAKYLLPLVVVVGFAATVPLAWKLAPQLRANRHYPELNRKW